MATVTGFRTPEEAALDLELSLLGLLRMPREATGPVAAASPNDDVEKREALRIVDRISDLAAGRDGCLGILGDVSPEQRARVAATLSASFAVDHTTLLVDADIRHAFLSFDDRRHAQEGLVDVLRYGVRSPRVMAPTSTPGLTLLPVGSRTVDLAGTFAADAVPGLFAELRRSGDVVLVNGPDLDDIDTAARLVREVGAWILVHELGVSDPERTRALRDHLGRPACLGILVLQGHDAEIHAPAAPSEEEIDPWESSPSPVPMAPIFDLEPAAAALPEEHSPLAAVERAMKAAESDRPAARPSDVATAPGARHSGRRGIMIVGALALITTLALAYFFRSGRSPAPAPAPTGSIATDITADPVPVTADPIVAPPVDAPITNEPTTLSQVAESPAASAPEPDPAPVVTERTAAPVPAQPTARSVTASSPAAGTVFAVHVSSVKSRAGADGEVAGYLSTGRPAFLKRTELPDKGTWWRIYLGPFEAREEAERVAAEMRAAGREYAQVHKVERSDIEDGTGEAR